VVRVDAYLEFSKLSSTFRVEKVTSMFLVRSLGVLTFVSGILFLSEISILFLGSSKRVCKTLAKWLFWLISFGLISYLFANVVCEPIGQWLE
jgi:hypothetical protein